MPILFAEGVASFEALALDHQLGDRLLAGAERLVPGLRRDIERITFVTPLDNLHHALAWNGGCYGPAMTPSQVGPGRFGVSVSVPGLFLCGSGSLSAGVFPTMLSGERAARQALFMLS